MEDKNILNPETDLVFYEKNKKIYGGAYKLNSDLLAKTIGDKYNNILDSNLGIPIGLLYIQNKSLQHFDKYENSDEIVDEDLYDKLLDMVKPNEKKLYSIKTRKNKIKKNKTRKN